MTSIDRTAYPRFRRSVPAKELQESFTPSQPEIEWARERARTSEHLLALFLLLKAFQRLGCFPDLFEIPLPVVDHIRGVVGLASSVVAEHASSRTGERQRDWVRERLGVVFDPPAAVQLARWVISEAALSKDNPADLINVALEQLIAARFELPGYSTLDELAATVRREVNDGIYAAVHARISETDRAVLTGLLRVDPVTRRSLFDELKRTAAAATVSRFREHVAHLSWLDGLGATDQWMAAVPPAKVSHFAAVARVSNAGDIREMAAIKQIVLIASLLHIAQQIADSLSQPAHLDEARVDTQVSIRVTFSSDVNPADDLLRQVDTAMYAAKTARIPISVHSPEMDRIRTERLELLADLRAALRTDPDQFLLHYQPKIDLNTGAIVGTEALVRWQHPRLGFIGPDRFIPLTEATDLIDELTPLVLNGALAECAKWTAQGHRVSVAVNLSARNIENPQLPQLVAHALRTHRVDPAQLILEITDSSAMGDPKQTMPVLHQLNELGLSLSLDDFGTGHSSLSYLQQLPVTEVKIDRSFVSGLNSADSASSRALVRSIAGLSKNLKLRVVAEGVEDEEQLAEVRELGCDIAQGYYISRPVPAHEIHLWLARRTAVPTPPLLRLLSQGAGL
ncbi:MAG: EAL domain-containing protein [Nakamurella sp.]